AFFFGCSRKCGVPCFLWDNNALFKNLPSGKYSDDCFGLINRDTYLWEEKSTLDAVMNAVKGKEK
ncbi:MAG: hypothetical protein KA051_02400, partial [Paludibacteraceae bacterium]|nr:hypothetical protein [Paludibacteraceae bacterium]